MGAKDKKKEKNDMHQKKIRWKPKEKKNIREVECWK